MNVSPNCSRNSAEPSSAASASGSDLRQQRKAELYGFSSCGPGSRFCAMPSRPDDDLRRDIEIRIGRRLADPVLDPRRRIVGRAEHPRHHAAMIVGPGGAVGRERIRLVAAIAVDGRRGEGRRGLRMLQQACEIMHAERRQRLAVLFAAGVNRFFFPARIASSTDADASRWRRSRQSPAAP